MTNLSTSVHQCLVSRIASGVYEDGTILPGCRLLAHELGVNKNTVTRAFRMLQEQGLIRRVRGVGMMVVRTPSESEKTELVDFTAELNEFARHARSLGLTRPQLEEICRRVVDRWYSDGQFKAVLVECNLWDARSLATDIESRFGIPVTPMLLSDFLVSPESVLAENDLVITTFYHLAEMSDAVPESLRGEIVAIEDIPSVDSKLALSSIPADSRITVVAAHSRTVQQLERTLESCGRKATCTWAMVDDPHSSKCALDLADVVVDSQRSHAELAAFGLKRGVPLITVSFEIHPQSIGFLQHKIEKLAAGGVKAPNK